jgi:CRP-like cAMP-binding protein
MAPKAHFTSPSGNQLLSRLPQDVYQRIQPHLQKIPLPFKHVLYKSQGPIDYVYFPVSGALSALTIMNDGSAIEVGTVGFEGAVGLTVLYGANISPNELIVQISGEGWRMESEKLKKSVSQEASLRELLQNYQTTFLMQVSQSVACNGLHQVQQRCARWLLETHDRVRDVVVPLTHEFLAIMLGVRRSTVSEILHPFQEEGLLKCGRGEITILDRQGLENASCECYRRVKDEFASLFGEA